MSDPLAAEVIGGAFLVLVAVIGGVASVLAARGSRKAAKVVTGNGHGTVTEIAERLEGRLIAMNDELTAHIETTHRHTLLTDDRLTTIELVADRHDAKLRSIEHRLHKDRPA